MICSGCGIEVKETARTCPACGAPADREAAGRNEVVLLAERVIGGDDAAWGEIYEKTHRYVYYTALKTLRDDQDAQDITQEVFIKAIDAVGQLKSADSFFGWLRSIIFSKCTDLIKKKKPVLLDVDDDGGSPLDDMPETGEDFLPEQVLDNAETRRMVLELVDDLPLAQRQTVLYYYYDEMTVTKIAELMECASGTVKSRLNYARQSIKKGVEEHEKKGVKLYGVGALPILTILLREQARAMLIPEALARGLSVFTGTAAGTAAGASAGGSAAAGTAAAGTTAGSAAGTAVTGVGTTLAGKVTIGVIVTAIVATGAVLIPRLVLTTPEESQPQAVTETAAVTTPPAIPGALTPTPEDTNQPEDNIQTAQLDVILTAEQLAFLEPLEEAMLTMDYETAYRIQSSEAFNSAFSDVLAKQMYGVYRVVQDHQWSISYHSNDSQVCFVFRYSPVSKTDGEVVVCTCYNDYGLGLGHFNLLNGKVNGEIRSIQYNHGREMYITDGTAVDGLAHGEETRLTKTLGSFGEDTLCRFIYENGRIINYKTRFIDGVPEYYVESEVGSAVYLVYPDKLYQIIDIYG